MSNRVTEKEKAEMRHLYEEGRSYAAIGRQIGRSEGTVAYWVNPIKREKERAYHQRNKEKRAEYRAVYREAHKNTERAYSALYYQTHKEKIQIRHRFYNQSHKKEIAVYKVVYNKVRKEERADYYQKHKEEIAAYRQAHKEEMAIKDKAYRQTSSGKAAHRAKSMKRYALTQGAQTDGNSEAVKAVYKLAASSKRVRCYLCGEWAPVGHRHVDHVMPLSKGGPHVSWNLAVVCDKCNLQKSAKLPAEFGLLL